MLSKVVGQEPAKTQLVRAFENDRLAHAYLLIGDEGVGTEELALEAAKYFLCTSRNTADHEPCQACSNCRRITSFQHPDVHYYFPALKSTPETELRELLETKSEQLYARVKIEGGTIHIGDPENPERNSVRGLMREVAMRSVENNIKIFILSCAEEMNAESANALLKVLEEPPSGTLYFLTSSQPGHLLTTIKSRCQTIRLHSVAEADIETAVRLSGVSPTELRLITRLSNGNMGHALQLMSGELMRRRERMLEFLVGVLSPQWFKVSECTEALAVEGRKDKDLILDILNLALTWFEDVLYVQNGLAESVVVNVDNLDRLNKFLRNFPQTNIEKTISELEKAVDLISRNVYLNLILINLGLSLRRLILAGR